MKAGSRFDRGPEGNGRGTNVEQLQGRSRRPKVRNRDRIRQQTARCVVGDAPVAGKDFQVGAISWDLLAAGLAVASVVSPIVRFRLRLNGIDL